MASLAKSSADAIRYRWETVGSELDGPKLGPLAGAVWRLSRGSQGLPG